MPFKKQLIVDLLHSVVDYEKIDAVKFALAIISGITDDVRKEVASMFESLKEFAKELDWRDPSKSAYDLILIPVATDAYLNCDQDSM